MIDMMQKFCRGRRLGVPFSVYLHTWFGLPGVRVSGGHLCEAEALTEPAGETVSPYATPIRLGVGAIHELPESSYQHTLERVIRE